MRTAILVVHASGYPQLSEILRICRDSLLPLTSNSRKKVTALIRFVSHETFPKIFQISDTRIVKHESRADLTCFPVLMDTKTGDIWAYGDAAMIGEAQPVYVGALSALGKPVVKKK